MEKGLDILVLAAPVHDCRTPITIEPGGTQIDPRSFRWILNPYDAGALETALRLREAIPASHVRVMSLGGSESEKILRECLAVGADEAIQVWDDVPQGVERYTVAVALTAAIRNVHFELLLCGSRRSDLEYGQVGVTVAELMDLPLVCAAREVLPGPTTSCVIVHKRIPGSLLKLKCPLPAVIGLESGPSLRYSKYTDRRRAARRPIPIFYPDSIGFSVSAARRAIAPTAVERFTPPKPRRRGPVASDASKLTAAARIHMATGGNLREASDTKMWECRDKKSVENVVQYMLNEGMVVF